MPIKTIHKIEQPREKLEKYGASKLSEIELLAILLRTGPKGLGVLGLAKKVLAKFTKKVDDQFGGEYLALSSASINELINIHGLGKAKAAEIVACFELGRRLLKDKKVKLLLSPREVWEECKDFRGSKKEHFVIFFLDTQNQILKREVISVGTLNASIIHPREVFEPAIKYSASHIIISHNHPSGSLEPSNEDLTVTKRLSDSGRILGIEIIDHIIVTKDGFMSFKDRNLLQDR
jgi:DNA repair protein RadC